MHPWHQKIKPPKSQGILPKPQKSEPRLMGIPPSCRGRRQLLTGRRALVLVVYHQPRPALLAEAPVVGLVLRTQAMKLWVHQLLSPGLLRLL